MKREELLITGVLLAVIATGGYFHFTAKEKHIDPIVVDRIDSSLSPGSAPVYRTHGTTAPANNAPKDINTATREDLMRVRGIGESLALAIVEYREREGAFQSMEGLLEVAGIGDARLKLLKERFFVEGATEAKAPEPARTGTPKPGPAKVVMAAKQPPTPVESRVIININRAAASEIERILPDIGPVLANRIVAWRDQHGPFQTIDALDQVSGIGPKRLESIRPFIKLSD